MKPSQSLIMRKAELAEKLGVSSTTIWRWVNKGDIPRPIILGPRIIGWEVAVIEQWLESKRTQEVKL